MAHQEYDGTPRANRAKSYIFPPRTHTAVWVSLALAAVLAVGLTGAYFAGVRRTLSPGDVASHHARVDLKCAQCHEEGSAAGAERGWWERVGGEVTAVRCERCHDPSGSDRLTQAAHVLLGSGDVRKAEAAVEGNCANCHTEHRGVSASLRAVDDRECAVCHNFASLARHPEFAAVRAQATAGVGIKFNHDRHILEAQKVAGAPCAPCHQPTSDRVTFVPMTFDRHCAACHAPKGTFEESDPIGQDLVVAVADLPEPWRSQTSVTSAPRGRKQIISGLRHRDGWVLYNAARLRSGIDSDGVAAERLALRGQIAYLEQFSTVRPVTQASAEELQAAATELGNDIAELDARLAGGDASDSDAIREIFDATRAIAQQLGAVDSGAPEIQEVAQVTLDPAAAPAPAPDPNAQQRYERRKAELIQVLDTIAARTADETIKKRAADLKSQVERLSPPAGAGTAEDAAPLVDRLAALDDVLGVIKAIPDPGVRAQVAQIDVLRSYGQQRVALGLSPEDFQQRKTELLSLLDEIERRGNPAIRVRAAALRQRVIAARPGSTGSTELTLDRKRRQKQLDRVRVQLELMTSRDQNEPPPAHDPGVDPQTIGAELTRLRAQLADLERAPRMMAADTAEDRDRRRGELDAVLSRCLKCHTYDPSGARIAPVRIAEPVMPRSIFNHAPHTTQTACETCHGSTATSKLATDINVPGVAGCISCHSPSKAKADCETCHVFHPSSPAKLVAVTR
jgi:hypothetical protein